MSETPETDAFPRTGCRIAPYERGLTEHARKLERERDMLRKALEIAVDEWAKFAPCANCIRIRATNGEQAEYCHPYEPKACRKVISDWLMTTAAKVEGQG